MKKILSYLIAITIGLLAVAPPIGYDIPLVFNSWPWIYGVIAAGLFGFFLLYQDIHILLKILSVYLFADCFLSQDPAASFTAYALVVIAIYFFIACKNCDVDILLDMIQAIFWFQVFISLVQYFGMDRLTCFGSTIQFNDQGELVKVVQAKVHHVFFGTVFQQMRLGSLFSVMAPFLLMKNKWYIVPLVILSVAMTTLGFAFAIVAGVMVYFLLMVKDTKVKVAVVLWGLFFAAFCADTNNHIHIELMEGRWPVWGVVLKTWMFDTAQNFHGFGSKLNPAHQTGPFSWKFLLFGHGMDTFLPLFQYYKYDPNPFPNAHNDWAQTPWEIGLIGAIIVDSYFFDVFRRLFINKLFLQVGGCMMISVNRFFAFPDRMTQTIFLMIAWVAICEVMIKNVSLNKRQSTAF